MTTSIKFMTITQYAEYRRRLGKPGGSRTAVYKAIKEKRIVVSENGLIDPQIADQMWLQRTLFRMTW